MHPSPLIQNSKPSPHNKKFQTIKPTAYNYTIEVNKGQYIEIS